MYKRQCKKKSLHHHVILERGEGGRHEGRQEGVMLTRNIKAKRGRVSR